MSEGENKKVGTVMVVGAGIAGMQSALDLAESGFKVYLVEKTGSIGGVMSALDKTFPTNDCAMCTISPTLVGTGRHHNIDIYTYSELDSVEGEAGNFKVKIKQHPRYINQEKCTGCGLCAQYCPVEAVSEFERGMGLRNATFVPFPQAVPLCFKIDKDKCLGCGLCERYCKAGAVDYEQEEEIIPLDVGSIILAPGFETFDPTVKKEYGFGRFQNVITSMQFERILSASGPYAGHVVRPSDGKHPRKIAWIQCVGSRDEKVEKGYCSAVCCTYATKEAIIAKEHEPETDATIFTMDIRTYGKGFEEYYNRAREEYNVKYIKCRIPKLEEIPDTKDLKISFRDQEGVLQEFEFNLVVLSVGLEPSDGTRELAEMIGIDLNEYGFAQTDPFTPLKTNKDGVFVSGVFQAPKDIPDTVAQALGAASKAGGALASVRNTMVTPKEYPPEVEDTGPPRVGVFACHCGINIGSIVDVPAVAEYARTLPNVVHTEHNLYTCSKDTQEKIKEMIKEHNLNRVIVASCTPRTHEPLFQSTVKETGINPYLFDLASTREHVSWVHKANPATATEKAKKIVAMAVEKIIRNRPVHKEPIETTSAALVIGGGIAGMTAAQDLAAQGSKVYLLEMTDKLGGNILNIYHLPDGLDPQARVQEVIDDITANENIEILLNSKLNDIKGFVGNFNAFVDNNGKEEEIEVGAIIVATGGKELQPEGYYLYGEDDRVVTQLEFDKQLKEKGVDADSVVMIQCVGSREPDRPYCSRVCCTEAIKNAILVKDTKPDTKVYVLFRDIRTYGFREKLYREAREKGVMFLRYLDDQKPEVTTVDGKLNVKVFLPSLNANMTLHPDQLVLSSAMIPYAENEELGPVLKIPMTEHNFFLEAHAKIKPLDFAAAGIFMCGAAASPKSIDEAVSQASGAASRAATILTKETLDTEGVPAVVDEDRCTGCGLCEANCPYEAIKVNPERGIAEVNEVLCMGCGACSSMCPSSAPALRQFDPEQIMHMVDRALGV